MAETCSFCAKGQEPGRRLIAGTGVFICSDCVQLASEVFANSEIDPKVRCAICRETGDAQDFLAFANQGYLCSSCVRAARAATDSLVK